MLPYDLFSCKTTENRMNEFNEEKNLYDLQVKQTV